MSCEVIVGLVLTFVIGLFFGMWIEREIIKEGVEKIDTH